MTQKVPANMTAEDLTDAEVVHKTGNETIAGDKTFSGASSFTGTAGFAAKFGYSAGGAVVQTGTKGNLVTLNKLTGIITMEAGNMVAGSTVTFQLDNTTIAANDFLYCTPQYPFIGYRIDTYAFAGGASALIRITNITGGALAEAVVLQFQVIKGAIA